MMFHGRMKDMLKVGGENVAAAEIESLPAAPPRGEARADGRSARTPRYVEVPAAFVELKPGTEVAGSRS